MRETSADSGRRLFALQPLAYPLLSMLSLSLSRALRPGAFSRCPGAFFLS